MMPSSSAWRTLALTSVAVFVVSLDGTVLFVAFPAIRATFVLVSAAQLSWVLNAYTIVFRGAARAGRTHRRSRRSQSPLPAPLVMIPVAIVAASGREPALSALSPDRV